MSQPYLSYVAHIFLTTVDAAIYLIAQNFGGQKYRKFGFVPKIWSAEKFCLPKGFSAEIFCLSRFSQYFR